jgi:hypothetical protein
MRFLPLVPALALLLGSCTTSPRPAATFAYVPSASACTMAGITDGNAFVATKVLTVTAFDPEATGSGYAVPKTSKTLPSGVKASLAQVFDDAPPFFRNHLCNLTAVLVDPSNAGRRQKAYGFFEGPDQGTHSNSYIGLPLGVFRGSTSFADNENATLSDLVKGWGGFVERPTIGTDPDRSRTLIVASQMAHEMGHILWQNRGVLAGGGCDFLSFSWSTVAAQPWRFHRFGETEKGSSPKGRSRDDLDLNSSMSRSQAGQYLKEIFESAQWASLFATIAPDEDWIETYRLLVLTQMRSGALSSLKVVQKAGSVPPFSVDVVSQLTTGTTLSSKAACVAKQAGG